MLCVVVLEVEDGDFSDLKGSALDIHSSVMVCVVVLEVEDSDFSDLKGSALDVHSSVIVLHLSERLTPNPSNR